MAAIPKPQHTTAQAVVQWRERTTDTSHRSHLGASVIGHQCDKHLWLLFRWAVSEKFDGRILRLFNTGKREEARVYEELRGIGCEVHADDGGSQFRVSAVAGFFGGSMDGAVLGVIEAPKTWHVLEIKTHRAKSFKDLEAKGVKLAKPQHWIQMQTYMHLTGMTRALYYAVNKDTDALHIERIEYDQAEGERIIARAERIISSTTPPQGISTDPAYFECKWCRFYEICHGTDAPEVNCRTCAHSTPDQTRGAWVCRGMVTLPDAHQRIGCADHLYIPPLLAKLGEPVDGSDEHVVYRTSAGDQFTNGLAPGFSSKEIHDCKDKRALTDKDVQALKQSIKTTKVIA